MMDDETNLTCHRASRIRKVRMAEEGEREQRRDREECRVRRYSRRGETPRDARRGLDAVIYTLRVSRATRDAESDDRRRPFFRQKDT